VLDSVQVRAVRLGRTVPATVDGTTGVLLRAGDGHIVAVAERADRPGGVLWQPRVVLVEAEATA